jgi:hypothetical protein
MFAIYFLDEYEKVDGLVATGEKESDEYSTIELFFSDSDWTMQVNSYPPLLTIHVLPFLGLSSLILSSLPFLPCPLQDWHILYFSYIAPSFSYPSCRSLFCPSFLFAPPLSCPYFF